MAQLSRFACTFTYTYASTIFAKVKSLLETALRPKFCFKPVSTLLLVAALVLSACTVVEKQEIIGKVDTLYNRGMDQLEQKKWHDAVNTFEELERQHPYSEWATRAQMMTAYAQFRAEDYDETVVTADRFIRLHPGHKDLPYMYYLKGMSHYYRISDVRRDQGSTRDALNAFEELVQRFPDSKYAQDAQLKITLCKDHLAGQEMMVGRFYQGQKKYEAAINRYQNVVKEFSRTPQSQEALFRITECYVALGVTDEAQRSAAILGYNYPKSEWYAKAYELLTEKKLAPVGQKDSWFTKVKAGIKDLF